MNGAGFLIDTNVLSELDKPYPDRRVTRFFDETDDALLYISDVVLAELRFGIEKVLDPVRRNRMLNWLHEIGRPLFQGRVLSVDENVWLLWKAGRSSLTTNTNAFRQSRLVTSLSTTGKRKIAGR